MVATSSTTKRTSERTPLLMQQQHQRYPAVDYYVRPIVDAMPLPVDADQCATTQMSVVSFAAKDLREKDREGRVICTNCDAPSQPNQPQHEQQQGDEHGNSQDQEESHNPEMQTIAVERRLSWRCWNCNMLHHRHDQQRQQQQQQGQLSASRFCTLQ